VVINGLQMLPLAKRALRAILSVDIANYAIKEVVPSINPDVPSQNEKVFFNPSMMLNCTKVGRKPD
jgi:hypothetical protein